MFRRSQLGHCEISTWWFEGSLRCSEGHWKCWVKSVFDWVQLSLEGVPEASNSFYHSSVWFKEGFFWLFFPQSPSIWVLRRLVKVDEDAELNNEDYSEHHPTAFCGHTGSVRRFWCSGMLESVSVCVKPRSLVCFNVLVIVSSGWISVLFIKLLHFDLLLQIIATLLSTSTILFPNRLPKVGERRPMRGGRTAGEAPPQALRPP